MKTIVIQKLFEECLYNYNEWLRLKNEFGEWDALVTLQHSKFSALYTVVENSGLEKEYQEWKAEQTNG